MCFSVYSTQTHAHAQCYTHTNFLMKRLTLSFRNVRFAWKKFDRRFRLLSNDKNALFSGYRGVAHLDFTKTNEFVCRKIDEITKINNIENPLHHADGS